MLVVDGGALLISRYGEGVTGVASVRILAWQLVQYGITDCVPQ